MRLLSGSILAVAAVLLLVVNLLSGYFLDGVQLDVTEHKLYTLSKGSKQIIADIEEPIRLRFYYSAKAQGDNHYLTTYSARVAAMLERYVAASNGKIKLEVIDPEPFSDAEKHAVEYGLQGVTLQEQEVYFGLVGTNALDTVQVIPFFLPNREANLEYDISQLLYNLAHPQARIVGLMSSLPLDARGQEWVIRQQMEQLFVVKDIDLQEPIIPSYITTLMVVEPSSFSTEAIEAIDEFVQQGGHVLAFVDPYSELAGSVAGSGNATELLASWGVVLLPDFVVADRNLARSVRISDKHHDFTVSYPLWIDLTTENFSADDVLTSSLDRITLASPGHLQPTLDASTYFMPLIYTSDEATLIPADEVPDTQSNITGYFNNYSPRGKSTVAARISGPIRSITKGSIIQQSNIIVIADADMLHDHFWVSMQNIMGKNYDVASSGNGNFVLSALDNLLGSNELIAVRNSGEFSRPLTKLQQWQQARIDKEVDPRMAQHKVQHELMQLKIIIQFLSYGLIPMLIIFIGLVVYARGFIRSRV